MYSFLMYFCIMIIVTGAAGFIGSVLVGKLNLLDKSNLILNTQDLEDRVLFPFHQKVRFEMYIITR